ncbi:MAG: iron-containing alcohol dehydrogenase [Firmicutes bacterium]|nr:iron-containing alcohol dehydrogenase [Bacillota bacterium]
MMIFEYKPQVRTLFGAGSINCLADEVKELNCHRVLCVYGRGTKAAGIADKAEESLRRAGVYYISFDRAHPDPDSALIDEIVSLARKENVDCIVGVGGGSNLDAVKAAAFMLGLGGRTKEYLSVPPRYFKASIPVILVPTTAGSGSEASNACVITHEDTGEKFPCLVDSTLAIVDPELACSLSPSSTAVTGMDALAHAVEAYLSVRCTPRAEMLALEAIRLIAHWLPLAWENGRDVEARSGMACACGWSGLATVDAPPHLGHRMAEGFVSQSSLPHGLICAWALPEVLSFLAETYPEKVQRVGEAMGLKFEPACAYEEIGSRTAQKVRDLMKNIQIKTPGEMGVDRETSLINPGILASPMLGCPVEITPETGQDLMARAYDNYR